MSNNGQSLFMSNPVITVEKPCAFSNFLIITIASSWNGNIENIMQNVVRDRTF